MNKQLVTLTLGLILAAPVCLAEEATTVAQNQGQTTEVSQPETAPVTEVVSSDVVAPEHTADEINPEEMNEEQLKAFLDQLVAELQKEEENKKKAQQDDTEAQTTETAPVAQ